MREIITTLDWQHKLILLHNTMEIKKNKKPYAML